jgi:phage-related protein
MALISVTISGNAAPLKNSVEESEGLLGRLGSSFTKIGAVAAAGFGAAAAAIGVAAKAAAEDQQSFEQMALSIENATGASRDMVKAIDEQIGKMSLATGVADDKLRPAYAALVRGTKDVETANRDFSLVLDISTALQMDATTVADALAKGYQGNMRALQALSPEMKTVIKDGASMNDVLNILGGTFGGAATVNANTFAGQMSRLKVFMSELVEQIGYYVLPVLTSLSEYFLNTIIPTFQAFADRYGPAISRTFETLADFITDKVVPAVRDHMIPFIQRLVEIIQTQVVPVIRDVAIKVLDGWRKIFEVVTDKIRDNQENIQKFVEYLRAAMGFIQQYVAPVLIKVLGFAFDVVATAIGPVIDVVFSLMGAFGKLGSFLIKVAGSILDTFESIVNGAIAFVNAIIRAYNKIPGLGDISPISGVSFTAPSLGAAPTAPTGAATVTTPAVSRGFEEAGFVPPTVPTIIPETGGGGGGGGGTRTVAPTPVDMTGQIGIIGSTEVFGGGGGGFGAAMGNEALLDGMTGGVSQVNITVNTVSADANLPNLIVDALQQYNLVSGPIDVAIAV